MSEEEKIFLIFNEIQNITNYKENLKSLYKLYESMNIKTFNKIIEDILLIIIYNYDNNNCPLKNIRDFIKNFVDTITKNQKLKKKNIEFLSYFCNLLTSSGKKQKYKWLSIYFLGIYNI